MTPKDAEQLMSSFYPHDPNLAMRAIRKELEGNIPDWICESIVSSYFNFLQIKDIQEKIDQKIDSLTDPFGFGTIPYTYGMNTDEVNSN